MQSELNKEQKTKNPACFFSVPFYDRWKIFPSFINAFFSLSRLHRQCFLKGASIDLRCWCCFSLWCESRSIPAPLGLCLHHSFTLQSWKWEAEVCVPVSVSVWEKEISYFTARSPDWHRHRLGFSGLSHIEIVPKPTWKCKYFNQVFNLRIIPSIESVSSIKCLITVFQGPYFQRWKKYSDLVFK